MLGISRPQFLKGYAASSASVGSAATIGKQKSSTAPNVLRNLSRLSLVHPLPSTGRLESRPANGAGKLVSVRGAAGLRVVAPVGLAIARGRWAVVRCR